MDIRDLQALDVPPSEPINNSPGPGMYSSQEQSSPTSSSDSPQNQPVEITTYTFVFDKP